MSALKSTVPVIVKLDVVQTVSALSTQTAVDTSFSVPGSVPGYPVSWWCEALESGLVMGHAYCSAAGTIKGRIANVTTGTITPASHTFRFIQR